jgi:hypothetical protein
MHFRVADDCRDQSLREKRTRRERFFVMNPAPLRTSPIVTMTGVELRFLGDDPSYLPSTLS